MILRHPIGSCHCSAPPPGAPISPAAAAPQRRGSPLLLRIRPAHAYTHVRHAFYAAVKRKRRCVHLRVCVLPCVISELRLGSQGEEPVVDSTLHREGAVHGGKRPFT